MSDCSANQVTANHVFTAPDGVETSADADALLIESLALLSHQRLHPATPEIPPATAGHASENAGPDSPDATPNERVQLANSELREALARISALECNLTRANTERDAWRAQKEIADERLSDLRVRTRRAMCWMISLAGAAAIEAIVQTSVR